MKKKLIYIAGPFAEPHHKEALLHMIDILKHDKDADKMDMYIPMDFKVEGDFQKEDGTWNLPNHVWAQKVFQNDLKELNEANMVVALYDGRKGTTGTAWEIGYAYAHDIPVVGYIPEYAKTEPMSLMVVNCFAGLLQEDGLVDTECVEWLSHMEQK